MLPPTRWGRSHPPCKAAPAGLITTELFDKAARERNGTVLAATQRSFDLRGMSRLVHLMGRISGERDAKALLPLLLDLAHLADTLRALRQAQERYHQAQAALDAASTLRAASQAVVMARPGRERTSCRRQEGVPVITGVGHRQCGLFGTRIPSADGQTDAGRQRNARRAGSAPENEPHQQV